MVVRAGRRHREIHSRRRICHERTDHGATGRATRTPPTFSQDLTKTPLDLGLPAPNPNRYQDYEAWMTVRVKDLQSLTDRTNEAMRATVGSVTL